MTDALLKPQQWLILTLHFKEANKYMKRTYTLDFGREIGTNVYNFLWARTYTNEFDLRYDIAIIKEALIKTSMLDKVEEYEEATITHVYIIIK